MSNRSSKLLLEVAATIEQQSTREPCHRLAGAYDVHCHAALVEEIVTWARGYREHLKRRGAKPSEVCRGHWGYSEGLRERGVIDPAKPATAPARFSPYSPRLSSTWGRILDAGANQ